MDTPIEQTEQASGFSPVITAERATEVTRGRQNSNDADKSNYFESE
jgi:hypothetical protein